jgi:hypothetical protein
MQVYLPLGLAYWKRIGYITPCPAQGGREGLDQKVLEREANTLGHKNHFNCLLQQFGAKLLGSSGPRMFWN